jgi:hypothetical protein
VGTPHQRALALSLIIALWPGCVCGPTFDGSADNGEGCSAGLDKAKCETDWDCDGSDICKRDDAGSVSCQPPDAPCSKDDDCPKGQYCGSPVGCGSGKPRCLAVPDEGPKACRKPEDCNPYEQCVDDGHAMYRHCDFVDASVDAPGDASDAPSDGGEQDAGAPDEGGVDALDGSELEVGEEQQGDALVE